MSNSITQKRLAAYKKQGGHCYYCQSPMWKKNIKSFAKKYKITKSYAKRFQCTAEHLTARCDGGSNEAGNIVAACLFCNNARHKRKTPKAPTEYKAFIYKRRSKGKWHPKWLQCI